MASYKWGISYEASLEDVEKLAEDFGFEYDKSDQEYVKEIRDWKPLKFNIKKDEIQVVFVWTGDATTEKYYDYLINCGILIGQFMFELEKLTSEYQTKLIEEIEDDDHILDAEFEEGGDD